MWIKSLDSDDWINITHITHFRIVEMQSGGGRRDSVPTKIFTAMAFLDASEKSLNYRPMAYGQDQTSIRVCQGSRGKCVWFIRWRRFRVWLSKWIGYLAAGTIGAILTYLLRQLK